MKKLPKTPSKSDKESKSDKGNKGSKKALASGNYLLEYDFEEQRVCIPPMFRMSTTVIIL